MLRIITLLNQKNHYLEKFYSLNETELIRFAAGDFEGLEEFYQTREKILEMIKYLDSEIDKVDAGSHAPSQEQKRELKEALAIKEEYVNRILSQDLQILSCIESAKSNIIRELQEIRRSRKAVGSYKSRIQDRRLDEEA
jgi:hypothetical protein